jgi:uncharacterized protein YjaG (DUF416 family)
MSQIIKLNLKKLKNLIATMDLKTKSLKFSEELNKLENILAKPDEYIYNEFAEIDRKLQLDSELVIAQIKESNGIHINADETHLADDQILNQIKNIKDKCQSMIEQVNYVSQEISVHWSNKHIDKVQFNKDLIYLTDYKNFVRNYLFQKKLMHKSAGKLLDKQQNMLHSLNEKVRNYLFNNNFIELRQIEQNKSQNSLNYFIYLKQPLYLNTNNIKEIDLNTILKLSSFQQTREKNLLA